MLTASASSILSIQKTFISANHPHSIPGLSKGDQIGTQRGTNERDRGEEKQCSTFSVVTLSGSRPRTRSGMLENSVWGRGWSTRVSRSHSPECIIDNWESELEILYDPIDPAAFRGGKRGPREGKTQGVVHLHSFDNSVDLVPPLRSFRLPPIKHDAVLNLSACARLPESEFKTKKGSISSRTEDPVRKEGNENHGNTQIRPHESQTQKVKKKAFRTGLGEELRPL